MRDALDMKSGYRLYVQDDGVGGRTYWSDEIGGGVMVWSTSLVSVDTLLDAIDYELDLELEEKKSPPVHQYPLWDPNEIKVSDEMF